MTGNPVVSNGFHILIVDDEPNIRSGLKKGLEKLADVIETAASVNEAIDHFESGSFQLSSSMFACLATATGSTSFRTCMNESRRQPRSSSLLTVPSKLPLKRCAAARSTLSRSQST